MIHLIIIYLVFGSDNSALLLVAHRYVYVFNVFCTSPIIWSECRWLTKDMVFLLEHRKDIVEGSE